MIRPLLAHAPRYAIAGASFFAIASLIPLLWLMLEGPSETGTSQVFGTNINAAEHSVWGLTYSGTAGTLLLWMEIFAVIAANVMTLLPHRFGGVLPQTLTRLRRIGHGYLTGWAGLWMLGAMHMASISPGFWTLQAIFLSALFACTVYRAFREWPSNAPSPTETVAVAPALPLPHADDAGPIKHRDPFTDIDDVSRFMLHRSALRRSSRPAGVHRDDNGLAWTTPHCVTADPLRDEYGEKVRAAGSRAIDAFRYAITFAFVQGKRLVVTASNAVSQKVRSARVRVDHPRQPVEIDVAAAENHTDALRIRRA